MNTIKHWLNTLPEPYKEQALKNTSEKQLSKFASSLPNALLTAFVWARTPEGWKYWNDIHYELIRPNESRILNINVESLSNTILDEKTDLHKIE